MIMRITGHRGSSIGSGLPAARGRRGQALLIAVLLMTVILLVGILFAALVSYNQGQSARHVDVVAAGQNAEAGINYANAQLQYSPQGADWRPRFVPYTGAGTEVATDPTTWPQDASTWPSPPAQYADGTVDFNFWGLDGVEGTEDDYYSDFDMLRGWFPLRAGRVTAPGRFLRLGFHRFPDPNQLGTDRDSLQIGRGYFLLQVTYDPDPPYEPDDPPTQNNMSNALRIVSIGRSVEQSNVFRRLEAYKPLGLTDHMVWITNQGGGAGQATMGIRPNVDLNASQSFEAGETLYSHILGPVRSAASLNWLGDEVDGEASTRFHLYTRPRDDEGYFRSDKIFAQRGLLALDELPSPAPVPAPTRATVSVDGAAPEPLPERLDPDAPAGSLPDRVAVGTQGMPELQPVELNPVDPVTGKSRYQALTRDSGVVVRATRSDSDHGVAVGDPVNIGMYGHGPGMYIDNVTDIQFMGPDGQSNLAALMNDWLRSPLGQGYVGSATGWDATFTTYTPPGVEIEFFPTEAAVEATATGGVAPGDDPTAVGVGQLWWPRHRVGAPGIKITRHDGRWRRADFDGAAWSVGGDSGRNVMVIDYPAYPQQVIFAEGNVRVKGILPARDRSIPDGPLDRSFDVTVVSNATIYIDGQLMTAQDVHGRRAGTNIASNEILDEDTAKVALLAKDHMCLNPTQIVPQLTAGLVTAAADDEANPSITDQHWELYPNSGGGVYSQWRFGWPDADRNNDGYGEGSPGSLPLVSSGADVHVNFVPIHAAADPGPSGMGMTAYNETAGNTQAYSFIAGAGLDPWTFIFVPPGALLGSVAGQRERISQAIAPNWQVPGSTPAFDFANPVQPFNLTGLNAAATTYISRDIGQANTVSVFQRDPEMGTGASAYLIKKWKIEECVNDADLGFQIPLPTAHARVNALMLAQRGAWFVIPGTYFDPTAGTDPGYDALYGGDATTVSALDSLYAARFRRYNYEIVVRGAITQNYTAPLEAQQTWMTRWAFPLYSGIGTGTLELAWGSIRYEFDERLRMARDQSPAEINTNVRRSPSDPDNVQGYLPKLPCLPASPTLIYVGGAL